MKILLFTHKSDIDGMGNVVLSLLAFDSVEYVLCEPYDLESQVLKYYEDKSIYNYDKIFITDLWLYEPTLSKIGNDKKLKDKLFIIDHHKPPFNQNIDNYPFITIKISDENGLCSATSLFYEYLIKNNFINDNNSIKQFVELTRKYDTWEWKTKYNDDLPRRLSLLYDSVGCNNYIDLIYKKLLNNTERFIFDNIEEMIINNKIKKVEEKIQNYIDKIYYKNVFNLKAGIIFIDYEYRNDIAEYLREKNYDIDFAILIALDKSYISYRSIKDDVDVNLIAQKMGGKGHTKAASSPIKNEKINEIIDLLIN